MSCHAPPRLLTTTVARRSVAVSVLFALSACSASSSQGSTTSASAKSIGAPTTAVVASTVAPVAIAPAVSAAPATTVVQAVSASVTAASTSTAKPGASVAPVTPVAPSAGAAAGLTSISVPSTADQYFVLYMKPNPALPLEVPVSMAKGKAGTTVLTDGRTQLPQDRYRIATFQISAPGDADGDGVDDVTEMADPIGMNPLNPAKAIKPSDGVVIIPDRATYEAMSYQGNEVSRDAYLAGQEFTKFWIVNANTDHPAVYFMNTNAYRAHPMFASAVGLPGGRAQGTMRGDVVWDPAAIGADGMPGVYRFAFQENDALPFAEVSVAFEVLSASMPFLTNNLMYFPLPQAAMPLYVVKEKALYDASRVPVLLKKG